MIVWVSSSITQYWKWPKFWPKRFLLVRQLFEAPRSLLWLLKLLCTGHQVTFMSPQRYYFSLSRPRGLFTVVVCLTFIADWEGLILTLFTICLIVCPLRVRQLTFSSFTVAKNIANVHNTFPSMTVIQMQDCWPF